MREPELEGKIEEHGTQRPTGAHAHLCLSVTQRVVGVRVGNSLFCSSLFRSHCSFPFYAQNKRAMRSCRSLQKEQCALVALCKRAMRSRRSFQKEGIPNPGVTPTFYMVKKEKNTAFFW